MKSKTDFDTQTKEEIRRRSGGRCEIHGPTCHDKATVFHHRLRRGVGGKGTAENAIHCCMWCHEYVHANPAVSYERGWLIRSGSAVVDIRQE